MSKPNDPPTHSVLWNFKFLSTALVGSLVMSGYPLGLGYVCSPRARRAINEVVGEGRCSAGLGGPLYELLSQLEGEKMEPLGETADLSGLFCTAAAISAELGEPGDTASRFEERMANSVALAEAAERTGLRPEVPRNRLRSGILLLRNETAGAEEAPADRLREAFHRRGVALSAYRSGLIRISMPQTHWLDDDLDHLRTALKQCP